MSRAAVWTGAGVEIRDIALPPLRDGDTLVRLRLATVCGSDLHTVTGRRAAPCPSVLGHEGVGTLVRGAGAGKAEVGDRVVWSVTSVCGRCARCRSGLTAKCESVRKVGHEPFDGDWPLSGTYAEHIVLPAGTTVVPVPDGLSDAVAAPAACATATVMATLEPMGDLSGRRVLICGAGMLGITAVAASVEAGADVAVTDIDAGRLAMAQGFGGAVDHGGRVDIAIDYTGSTDAVGAALDRLDIGGILVLAGSVLPGPPLSVAPETVVRHWLTIMGVHNYEPRHLYQAIGFLNRTRARYPWADVVAEPVGLDAIATALGPPPPGTLRSAVALGTTC